MRVKKLNSDKIVSITTYKYLINWETDGNSKPERLFRDLIYKYWKNQIILFQFRIPGSLLKIDFLNVNKRLAVEIDGAQHDKFNPFFHNNSKNTFVQAMKRDIDKDEWCEDNQIKILRLNEEDLDNFSFKAIEKQFGISLV